MLKHASLSGLTPDLTNEQIDFLSFLKPLNIGARYSTYKDDIALQTRYNFGA
ncbi:MAG: hypothetical protein LBS83_00550 [Holosporales bacterium]|nr:hypothetical protein [Holosporales bacterium]